MSRKLRSVLAGSAAGALVIAGSVIGVAAPASASPSVSYAAVESNGSAPQISQTAVVRSHLVRQKKYSGCQIILKHDLKRWKKKYLRAWVTQQCKWVKQPGYVGYYEGRIAYDTSATIY